MFPRLTLACPVCLSLPSLCLQLLVHPPSNTLKDFTSICICLGTIHSGRFIRATVLERSCSLPWTHTQAAFAPSLFSKTFYSQNCIWRKNSQQMIFLCFFNLRRLRSTDCITVCGFKSEAEWGGSQGLMNQQYCYTTREEMHFISCSSFTSERLVTLSIDNPPLRRRNCLS